MSTSWSCKLILHKETSNGQIDEAAEILVHGTMIEAAKESSTPMAQHYCNLQATIIVHLTHSLHNVRIAGCCRRKKSRRHNCKKGWKEPVQKARVSWWILTLTNI